MGIENKGRLWICALIGLAAGFINGLFGSGGGTIIVPALALLLLMNQNEAQATTIFIILPLTIISCIFYIINGYVDWSVTLKVIIGGIAGGVVGAKILSKISPKLLRIIFGLFMIIASVRMLIN